MRGSTFMDAAASSTRVIGRKDDVKVLFEGSQAATNGDTVYLPAIPTMADVGEEDGDVIRGYRDHETMHIRCTDMRALETLSAISNDKLLYELSQYCEDIRIENAGVQSYPGMRRTFSATNREAASLIEENIRDAKMKVPEAVAQCPPDKALLIALQAEGRRAIGVDLGFYEEFLKHADPKLVALAKKWAPEMAKLETGVTDGNLDSAESKKHTKDAFDLAARIKADYVAETQRQEPEPEPKPEPGEGEPGEGEPGDGRGQPGKPSAKGKGKGKPTGSDGEGESGDQPGGTEGKGDSESSDGGDGGQSGDDDGEGEGDDEGEESGGSSGDGEEEGEGPQSGEVKSEVVSNESKAEKSGSAGKSTSVGKNTAGTNTEMFDTDYKDALKSTVAAIEKEAATKLKIEHGKKVAVWRRFSEKLKIKASIHDLDPASYPRAAMPQHFTDQFNAAHARIRDKAAMIRRTIELELQARFDRVWQPGHKSGRLHSPRLVDAMNGAENVYQRRETGRDIDTLLVMSIDGSGSMDGPRMERCQELAIALGEALERTGADIEIEVWDDYFPRDAGVRAKYGVDNLNLNEVSKRYSEDLERYINEEAKRLHGVDDWSMVPDPYTFKEERVCKRRLFATIGNLVRRVVKSRKQRMTDPNTRAALGAITNLAGGGTPMIDAVTWTMLDMVKEKHGKKILLLMTDGIPNSAIEFDDYEPHLAQMKYLHKMADEHGIHLIGVGINADVSDYFRDYVRVGSADAYEKVMKKIASHLREERRAARRAA